MKNFLFVCLCELLCDVNRARGVFILSSYYVYLNDFEDGPPKTIVSIITGKRRFPKAGHSPKPDARIPNTKHQTPTAPPKISISPS